MTAGEEASSPTGTMVSFSSVPNGKKLAGTAGSLRQLIGPVKPPTSSRKSGIDSIVCIVEDT